MNSALINSKLMNFKLINSKLITDLPTDNGIAADRGI
jgi:hypothetical protein